MYNLFKIGTTKRKLSVNLHTSDIIKLIITSFIPDLAKLTRDISVNIATRKWARQPKSCSSILGKGQGFFSIIYSLVLGNTQPPIQWEMSAVPPGVKQQGYEADYSPPSSAEIKHGGAIPPLLNMSSWCGA
jgi:hypothetical protein